MGLISKHEIETDKVKQEMIKPFVKNNLTPFGIDLTVGKRGWSLREGILINLEQPYSMVPDECIIVETEERLEVPSDYFGLVFYKARLAREKGLVLLGGGGKIDPGWDNKLEIPLKNEGQQAVKVVRGMPICCVALFRM